MTDSSPVLPNSSSSSSSSSNKMTKSYLLESDPFLKTPSSKTTSPFALNSNNAEDASGAGDGNASVGSGGGSGAHRGHYHPHHRPAATNWSQYHDDAAAAAAAAAAIQQQFHQQHLQLQQHSIPGHDLFSDRPTVKPPLAMHHVQPIAYINGNSVRPVRCRHYSQQQTALSVLYQQQQQQQQQLEAQQKALKQLQQHNNGRNFGAGGVGGGRGGIDSMSESTSSTSSASSSSSGSIGSDSHEDMIMEHDGLGHNSNNASGNAADAPVGPVLYGAGNAINGSGSSQRRVQFADTHLMNSSTTSSSTASSTSYSTSSNSNSNYSSSHSQQQSSANQQPPPRSKSSWFSLFTSFSFSSSTSSSSSSQRDSVTNDENEFNIHSLCSDQPEQVIEYLAKVIAAQLRDARENRRLVCRELFLPNDLLGNIAAKVRTLAETEPCGLRGCKFYICIEDKEAAAAAASVSTSGTLLNSGTNSTTQSMTSGDSLQQQHSNSQSWVNSRLLGEVALDRTMVPTFEVFLTLKPTLPNWFDALESRLFGRERIILAENYLLHKKKLYHQNTAPTSNM